MTFEQLMEEHGVKKLKDYTPYISWQCQRKVSFRTEEQARQHMKKLKHSFEVYHCPECNQFHLTSVGGESKCK